MKEVCGRELREDSYGVEEGRDRVVWREPGIEGIEEFGRWYRGEGRLVDLR